MSSHFPLPVCTCVGSREGGEEGAGPAVGQLQGTVARSPSRPVHWFLVLFYSGSLTCHLGLGDMVLRATPFLGPRRSDFISFKIRRHRR